MKKILLSLIVTMGALNAAAQTEVLKIDLGDTVVTYKLADIKEISFDTEEEKVDTTLFHSFDGYLMVSSQYFQDQYYGNQAKLAVYKTSKGEYIVTFSDPQWGDAVFGNVSVGRELAGEGINTMAYRGNVSTYSATLSGPMTTPVITMPNVMSGTVITFHVGQPPVAYLIEGNHKGTNNVVVGGQFGPYTAEITYKITANKDGSINIVLPEYPLTGTVMGDLTLGSYTISNIAYDAERGAFFRDYTNDGLTMHLTAVNNGQTTMNSDYTFERYGGSITITPTETGINVSHTFQPGAMPFGITATMEGVKQANLR